MGVSYLFTPENRFIFALRFSFKQKAFTKCLIFSKRFVGLFISL
jgi:hypothetical protein